MLYVARITPLEIPDLPGSFQASELWARQLLAWGRGEGPPPDGVEALESGPPPAEVMARRSPA